ncbi:hypothetical protein ACFL3G_13375 [Planctomycetota bacterium]
MLEKSKVKFECRECGSNELGYHKYVKCITPVKLQQSGHMEYRLSRFFEDDYLYTDNGFICLGCELDVEHCGLRMETEKELLDYLSMDPGIREQQQQEYNEYIEAQALAQEQNCCDEFK